MTTTQPTTFKVTEAATILNVPPNTVRNWTAQYGELLDAGARAHGEVRLLTEQDVRTLAMIRDGRAAGKPAKVIALEVAQVNAADRPPAGVIVDATEAPERTESALMVVPGLDAIPAAIVAQLSPLLAAEFERGRELGQAEGRRKVPPEYVLLAVIVALVALTVAALVLAP